MAQLHSTLASRENRATALLPTAGISLLAAVGLVVYGAYGDPNAGHHQRSAVPAICAITLVLAAIVFAVASRALRAVDTDARTSGRWLAGFAAATVLSLPVFWTGLPLLTGAATVFLGRRGQIRSAGRVAGIATAVGTAVMVLIVVWTILSNTVLS